MKSIVVLVATLAAVAGPAAAEFGRAAGPSGFQTPRSGLSPSPGATSYGAPYGSQPGATTPKPKTYGAPAAEPFKPYEPYRTAPGNSVFGPDGRKKR